jgi:hypothetical protein
LESRRLRFDNFPGPFVTHGIDVIEDPDKIGAYYIFAINHLPNPNHQAGSKSTHKARSQIEVFRYVSGSSSVDYVRSIIHPLIQTPNDIYVTSPSSFYVTNDHYYREGNLRVYEDFVSAAKWSTVVYVDFSKIFSNTDADIHASIVLRGIHNNNGMGHGKPSDDQKPPEVLVASAGSGLLHLTSTLNADKNDPTLSIKEIIELDSTIDNPTYFYDPYPHINGDASGYILAGLPRAPDFVHRLREKEVKDPAWVWFVQRNPAYNETRSGAQEKWTKRLIFEDDGSMIRGATTAVLVPIAPELENGEKKGWLFITSVFGKSTVAVKISL